MPFTEDAPSSNNRYRYFKVSLRKKLSILSSCSLDKTSLMAANPHWIVRVGATMYYVYFGIVQQIREHLLADI